MSGQNVTRPATVEQHRFEDDGRIPNNPHLPLLVYRGALALGIDPASDFEVIFAANGWGGSWRNGIYPYHHYHSTAHEVLGVARGAAAVTLGGQRGATVRVQAGDVLVIPAGVGHKNEGAEEGFLVVGAYADDRDWDICTGTPDERQRTLDNIGRVPRPAADPVYGADGPLIRHWRR